MISLEAAEPSPFTAQSGVFPDRIQNSTARPMTMTPISVRATFSYSSF